jgi:hypothetical protein
MLKSFRLSEKSSVYLEPTIEEKEMKSLYFTTAIINRNRVRFLYGFEEIILEPYYISKNKFGKKVLYGRQYGANAVALFEYDKICNIKILGLEKFSPLIPIMPVLN